MMGTLPYIRNIITLKGVEAELRAAKPGRIWWSVVTCWWTHRESDVRSRSDNGMPCDPRGGVLMMVEGQGATDFIAAARANPAHYGQYGIAAFMAAHNANCEIRYKRPRIIVPWAMRTWDEYNAAIERQTAKAGKPY